MSGLVNSILSILGKLWTSTADGFEKILPPDKRAEMSSKLQDFASTNPKLAAFLVTHVVLTGVPILLFIAFSVSILVFSLITALFASLLAAVFFTLFMVGVALLFLVPTLCLTTFFASFLFLWGLGAFYILRWFTEGGSPASGRRAISDQVEAFTGGRTKRLSGEASGKLELGHSGGDKESKAHTDDHDGKYEVVNGKTSERQLQKVTEDLRDDTNEQLNGPPMRVLKIVEGDENAASAEKPAAAIAK